MGNASGREEDAVAVDGDGADVEDGGGDSSVRSSERGFPPYGSGGANHVRRACSVGVVGGGGGAGSPPGSPGHSLSPRMFVPQTPVPPLQRAADVTPVFNQILMNEQEEEYDGPPQKEIPALIVWTLGGKNVYVEGSWDNWKSRKAMQKSGKDYSLLLVLPSGVYRYRFVVDGERRCLPDLPCETDAMGNAVNLLDVNDFVPESVESVAEFESPPSPDSSYSFQAPEEKDFAKEPPALPSQLHLGVLNSQNSVESCARPQHIVLNHLFIEKGWGAHPLVALGLRLSPTSRTHTRHPFLRLGLAQEEVTHPKFGLLQQRTQISTASPSSPRDILLRARHPDGGAPCASPLRCRRAAPPQHAPALRPGISSATRWRSGSPRSGRSSCSAFFRLGAPPPLASSRAPTVACSGHRRLPPMRRPLPAWRSRRPLRGGSSRRRFASVEREDANLPAGSRGTQNRGRVCVFRWRLLFRATRCILRMRRVLRLRLETV